MKIFAIIISFVALTVIIWMGLKITHLNKKIECSREPKSGDIRQGYVFVKLDDPLYGRASDVDLEGSKPIGFIGNYINTKFNEDDIYVVLGIKYNAISTNGLFLVELNGMSVWVKPIQTRGEYTIRIER